MIASWRERSVNRKIFAGTVVVGGFLSLVKLTGAVKVVLMARVFGASDALDAFLVAFLLPSFFADIVAGTLSGALIPNLIEVRERQGRQQMERLHSSITAGFLMVLAAAAVLLALASPLILRLVGAGLSEETRALAQRQFYWLLPLLPLGAITVAWRGALNAQEHFAIAALASATTPVLAVTLLAVAGSRGSVWLLTIASVVGIATELATLGVGLKMIDFPLLPHWRGWDEPTRKVVEQHLPLIAVAAINGGNLLVDQSMAATLGSGNVSALNYGTRLCTVLAGIGGAALSTAALPHFSRMVAIRDWAGVRNTAREYGRLILLAGVPVTLLLTAVSGPLVRVLFQGGAFTGAAAETVTRIQQFSLLQLPLSVLLAMLLRLISSLNANVVVIRVTLVAVIVNVAGDYALMRLLGVAGIALSSTLVHLITLIWVFLLVRDRLPFEHP